MSDDTLSSLEAQQEELEYRIADISAQLDQAKHEAAETGVYRDAKWFSSAQAAKRYMGIELASVNRRLKKLRQHKQEAKDQAWEQAFVRMAKQTLAEETYDNLVALAWQEVGGRP